MTAPLAGIKVVELARILAGPFAGQTLADLGADVVTVESPEGYDTRQWGPPWIENEGERTAQPIRYRVRVVRDVSTSLWFLVALVLIVVPPILTTRRAFTFERQRWQESDHG